MIGALTLANAILLRVLLVVAMFCLLVIAGSLTLGILMRFFLGTPLIGGDDFARIAMVWLAMLTAPLGIYHSEHVALSFLTDRVSGLAAKLLQLTGLAVIGFVCVAALLYSGPFLRGGFSQMLASLPWLSQGYGYLAVPVGFALCAWVTAVMGIAIIAGQDGPPEAPLGSEGESPGEGDI